MANYDLLNGGLEKLQKDLDNYVNYLTYANMELVSTLSSIAKNDIVSNASRAYEIEQRIDLNTRTVVETHKRGKYISSDRVVNDSPKATFAEFGYGVLGANSEYSHGDFLDRYAIGWYGYNIDTPNKLPNGSWFYTDVFGERHNTFGAVPRNIFYNASRKVIDSFPYVSRNIFNRWSK